MKEKIKSEIQRLIKAYSPIQSAEGKYKVEAYEDLLTYINSLEDPANEDLEEFSKRESELFGEREYEVDYIDRNALTKGFYWGCKTGAQWQKKQDQSTIEFAEDHAMLAGMEKMNQEMMENVVLETKVMKDSDGDGIDTPYEEWLTLEDTEIPFIPDNIGLKDGDKVKILIIKQ